MNTFEDSISRIEALLDAGNAVAVWDECEALPGIVLRDSENVFAKCEDRFITAIVEDAPLSYRELRPGRRYTWVVNSGEGRYFGDSCDLAEESELEWITA